MLLHFFSFKDAFENRGTNPEMSQTLDTIASERKKIFVSDASTNSTSFIFSLDVIDWWMEVVNKIINVN